jgi:hypothetical protein
MLVLCLLIIGEPEASYSTTDNLLPPAPNIDFSALLSHSPHQSTNCSLCLLGTNRPSGERDVSSSANGDQLPTIIEPCSPSAVANKDVHWFLLCWRSFTEVWTRKVQRDSSLDVHVRNVERKQPSSTSDEAISDTLTVTDRHPQSFGHWGSLRGILSKSYSTPDLRSEIGHNQSFPASWMSQFNRGQDGLPHRHYDSLSPPV